VHTNVGMALVFDANHTHVGIPCIADALPACLEHIQSLLRQRFAEASDRRDSVIGQYMAGHEAAASTSRAWNQQVHINPKPYKTLDVPAREADNPRERRESQCMTMKMRMSVRARASGALVHLAAQGSISCMILTILMKGYGGWRTRRRRAACRGSASICRRAACGGCVGLLKLFECRQEGGAAGADRAVCKLYWDEARGGRAFAVDRRGRGALSRSQGLATVRDGGIDLAPPYYDSTVPPR
jgi:hypothetical protein